MKLFNDTNQPPAVTKRNPWIALVLSLFVPGLGQVYNGQLPKGAIGVALLILMPFVFGLTRWTTYFTGLLILIFLELCLKLWLIIDAFIHAKRLQQYVRKSYNTWLNHLLIGLGVFVVVIVFDVKELMGVETFVIPSAAMEPTIKVGDYVSVDLWAYKNEQPAYGHIIAAKAEDGQVYAFRVVGLPGDEVQIIDNQPVVNGKAWPFIEQGISSSGGWEVQEFSAKVPKGLEYRGYTILNLPTRNRLQPNHGPVMVTNDSFFLLADSRDNGVDSRFLGTFRKEDIKGRLVYTYWGASWGRVGLDLRHQ